jgi:hypothetical protein
MDKRQFLTTAAIGVTGMSSISQASPRGARQIGPTLLTITGNIARGNRGPFDPALDQMMRKQEIEFDKAYTFDFHAIDAMPKVNINPTLEYDLKSHALAGPLLTDVLHAAGAILNASTKVLLRALDGYAVAVPVADLRQYRFIIASRLDGQPMALGGLGPLWAVYDADRFPDMKAKPVNQRFGLCPWGLYHIEIQAG